MGLFDTIDASALGLVGNFQTKDTPAQFLDLYRFTRDGALEHQAYDVEDQSDHNATGIGRFVGCMSRVNKRWQQCMITGPITFYGDEGRFCAFVVNGVCQQVLSTNGAEARAVWARSATVTRSGGTR